MKEIRVAKILDDYKIVINAGSLDGIDEGTRVIIYQVGDDITDPVTNESLGKLEIIKGTGTVTHVQDKIATVESNMKRDSGKTIRRRNPYSSAMMASLASMVQPYETIEELPREPKPFEDPIVGDLIRITRK